MVFKLIEVGCDAFANLPTPLFTANSALVQPAGQTYLLSPVQQSHYKTLMIDAHLSQRDDALAGRQVTPILEQESLATVAKQTGERLFAYEPVRTAGHSRKPVSRKPVIVTSATSSVKAKANPLRRKQSRILRRAASFATADFSRLPPPSPPPLPPIKRFDQVGFDDFKIKGLLGCGTQGKVFVVKHATGLHVLKVIDKVKTSEEGETDLILSEQRVMKDIRSNAFMAELKASFHDAHFFYLVQPIYPGGDLEQLIEPIGAVSTDAALFYISEMVVGLEFLHSLNIMHRDLKPCNVFIKADGHICIGDFGGSRQFEGRGASKQRTHVTSSQCGTVPYMAPELFQNLPYSYGIDLWSLGVTLHELLTGKLPFNGNTTKVYITGAVYSDINPFPPDIDADGESLIRALLVKDTDERLSLFGVIKHPFFRQISWDDVKAMRLTPPFIPSSPTPSYSKNRKDLRFEPGPRYHHDPHPQYNWTSPKLVGVAAKASIRRKDVPGQASWDTLQEPCLSFDSTIAVLETLGGHRRRGSQSVMPARSNTQKSKWQKMWGWIDPKSQRE